MRPPHLLLANAMRGVLHRVTGEGEHHASLTGHAYPPAPAPVVVTCSVKGCGQPVEVIDPTRALDGQLCPRCAEELDAIVRASVIAEPEHPVSGWPVDPG